MAPLRWGIVSVGRISHDFVVALSTLPPSEHAVVACAARSLQDAKNFALLHEIPEYYEGYEALMRDQKIDVVYIGTVVKTHYEICVMALNNKKHVLCEKPLAMNSKQAAKIFDLAKDKNRFFMEAIWSRCVPSYKYAKERIQSGALGEIREIEITFGFDLKGLERVESKELGGSATLDLGAYPIQASLWALGEAPVRVEVSGKTNEEGVDLEIESKLFFANGAVSRIKVSALEPYENACRIIGSKGTIKLLRFWCPISLIDVDGERKEWPLPRADIAFNLENSCGLRYEAEEVRQCIIKGLLESPLVTHSDSIRIAVIQDQWRKALGNHFPEDDE